MSKVDESDDAPAAKGHCIKWCPVAGINSVCADIGLVYEPPARLTLRLYFSHIRGNPLKDIRLKFEYVAGFHYEDECFYGACLPDELPRAEGRGFTFPLLIIEDSPWASAMTARHSQGEGCVHYVFLSLNDIVEVLAPPPVHAEWVPATDK